MPLPNRTCFVVRVPLETLCDKLGMEIDDAALPFFMCQIAVRREVASDGLAASGVTGDAAEQKLASEALASDWSPPLWLQFFPNIQYLLPKAWRRAAEDGTVIPLRTETTGSDRGIVVDGLAAFSADIQEASEIWLILTKRVLDVTGQPLELYAATYVQSRREPSDEPSRFERSDGDPIELPFQGYARLMLVRRRKNPTHIQPSGTSSKDQNIWRQLLVPSEAASSDEKSPPTADAIIEDAKYATPIFSPRVAVSIKKLRTQRASDNDGLQDHPHQCNISLE